MLGTIHSASTLMEVFIVIVALDILEMAITVQVKLIHVIPMTLSVHALFMIDYHTDIDECQMNPCEDVNNTYCINTNGSYSCECYPGYVRNGTIQCTGTHNS